MVMEIMTGGELFDRIVEKEFYSEKEACDVIKPIVDAINYCHKMGFAHRDLKVIIINSLKWKNSILALLTIKNFNV